MVLTEYNQYGNLGYLDAPRSARSARSVGLHFQDGKFKYFYICDFFYNVYKLNLKIFSFDINIYGDDDDYNNDCLFCFNSKQYGYL